MADIASWGKFLMKTINTMNLHGGIDGKCNAIETLVTSNATKTLSMIRFASSTENLIEINLSITFISTIVQFTRSVIGKAQTTHFSNEC